jgi:hypothetical protein
MSRWFDAAIADAETIEATPEPLRYSCWNSPTSSTQQRPRSATGVARKVDCRNWPSSCAPMQHWSPTMLERARPRSNG